MKEHKVHICVALSRLNIDSALISLLGTCIRNWHQHLGCESSFELFYHNTSNANRSVSKPAQDAVGLPTASLGIFSSTVDSGALRSYILPPERAHVAIFLS